MNEECGNSESLALRVLGPPVLVVGSDERPLAPERRWQVLFVLAHDRDWMRREALASLLWPELSAERSRRNLRKILHTLRDDPVASAGLREQGDLLRWDVRTDVAEFEDALARLDLQAAAALWRGDPWQGLDGTAGEALDDWLRYHRQRLRTRWRETLLQLCRTGDAASQLRWADKLLEHDGLDEDAVRAKIHALAQAGRHGDIARDAYEPFAAELAGRTGLEPTAALRAWASPSASNPSVATSLLAADETAVAEESCEAETDRRDRAFIGRDAELKSLGELLARPDVRWITLHGPGGVGKSRLLARAVDALRSDFGDGSCLLSLEDLAHPQLVASLLAQAIGLHLRAGDEPLNQVCRALADRHMLLGIDNLESALDVVPALFGVLKACPHVKLIASSRERADVGGEWVLAIDGLPYPEPEDDDHAEQFDAVTLFARRARASEPRFDLAGERMAVASLCRLVQGLPLALELAAVWTRYLGVDEIARDIEAGGVILSESSERRPARQRSLAATFEYSWLRLVQAEQQALMRLSVFRGGFTREAAQWVAQTNLGVLAALTDKSLVQMEHPVRGRSAGSPARFGLHPLVRQFAGDRLSASPEIQRASEEAHAVYYCRLLSKVRVTSTRPDPRLIAELKREAPNLAVAWQRASMFGRADLLDESLYGFCDLHIREERVGEGALALRDAEPFLSSEVLLRGRVRAYRTVLHEIDDDPQAATEAGFLALEDLKGAPPSHAEVVCRQFLAVAHHELGHGEEATTGLKEAFEMASRCHIPSSENHALHDLARCLSDLGRHDEALGVLEELWAREAVAGNSVIWLRLTQFRILRAAGRAADAVRRLRQLERECPPEAVRALARRLPAVLAPALFDLGDLDGAEATASEAIHHPIAHTDRDVQRDLSLHALLAQIALRRGQLEVARNRLRSGAALVRTIRMSMSNELPRLVTVWCEYLHAAGHPRAEGVLTYLEQCAVLKSELREIIVRLRTVHPPQPDTKPISIATILSDMLSAA